jgi:hypothetical protein
MSTLWTVPHGGVMVWADISYVQRTQLHFIAGNLNAQRYREEILRHIVVPFIHRHHLMVQYDSARPHFTRIWTQFLEAENIKVLTLSCIITRHVTHWACLECSGKNVYDSLFQFPTLSSNFTQPLKSRGTFIPQVTVNSLSRSMQRRDAVLHEANGCHTRYWLVFWSTSFFLRFFLRIHFFLFLICDQQMHIFLPSHVKSID